MKSKFIILLLSTSMASIGVAADLYLIGAIGYMSFIICFLLYQRSFRRKLGKSFNDDIIYKERP